MPLAKPTAKPGFQSQATQVQATGAWYGGNLVRWRNGLLEKWLGWQRLFPDSMAAVIRRFHAWLDLGNHKNLLVATDAGVQLAVDNTIYGLGHQIDLPGGYIVETGPGAVTTFSATSGSVTVTVNSTIPAIVGGSFTFRLSVSIGGRIIQAGKVFPIKAIVTGGFTFDMPIAALATETNTYGVRLYSNDFPNRMQCTWKSHGFAVGNTLTIRQATTVRFGAVGVWEGVNFSAPAGTVVTVDTVGDVDHFTFVMGALGTGDGAGGPTHQVYEGCSVEHGTSGSFTSSIGTVIGIAAAQPLGNPQKQSWFLANLGQDGLVLATGGQLQVYHPPIENGPFLTVVGNIVPFTAPQQSNGMIVAMPQAQVILFGTEPIMGSGVIDPLLLRWSDVGTYDVYNATVSNQAGSYRLSRGSRIVGAIQAPQATLIFTDTDCWMMSYIGPPLVYGFTIMGSGCGLVAPHAVAVLGQLTVWEAVKGFWQFGGGGVQPLLSSVWDYIFENLDPVNINKCHAAPNSSTNEIAFFFPPQSKAVIISGNLLLWSTALYELSAWSPSGATAQTYQLFRANYVYEPQYVILGWFQDQGIALVSWYDRDVQGVVTTIIHAPDGSGTTINLQETAVDGMHSISQTISKRGDQVTYTLSVFAHINSTRNLTLRAGSNTGYAFATFDVVHGNVVTSGVTTPLFQFLQARVMTVLTDPVVASGPGGNGWLRYVMTFTTDTSNDLTVFFNITNGTQLSYTGSPPNGCLIWGPQLVEGGEPGDYDPTVGTQLQNETSFYVKLNVGEGGAWDSGELQRSAWLDNSVWGTPLGADAENLVQQHERGFDADLEPMRGVYAETGFTEIGDGSMIMMIDEVHPDFKWFGVNGSVKATLKAANYPQGPQHPYGPYSMTPTTQFFSPRVRARYVAIRYDWEPLRGFSARVGASTFRLKPAGKRP